MAYKTFDDALLTIGTYGPKAAEWMIQLANAIVLLVIFRVAAHKSSSTFITTLNYLLTIAIVVHMTRPLSYALVLIDKMVPKKWPIVIGVGLVLGIAMTWLVLQIAPAIDQIVEDLITSGISG